MPRLGRCFFNYNSKCILLIKYSIINDQSRLKSTGTESYLSDTQTLKTFASCLTDEPQYEPVSNPSLDFCSSDISF